MLKIRRPQKRPGWSLSNYQELTSQLRYQQGVHFLSRLHGSTRPKDKAFEGHMRMQAGIISFSHTPHCAVNAASMVPLLSSR
jgi:hypothetical protein